MANGVLVQGVGFILTGGANRGEDGDGGQDGGGGKGRDGYAQNDGAGDEGKSVSRGGEEQGLDVSREEEEEEMSFVRDVEEDDGGEVEVQRKGNEVLGLASDYLDEREMFGEESVFDGGGEDEGIFSAWPVELLFPDPED